MGVLFPGTDRGIFVVYVILYLVSSLLLQQIQNVNSEPTQDKQALLAFISQIPHANRLQWNQSDSACNWVGVECDPNQSYVYIIRLPGVGLVGPIPPNTLGNLTQLRVLSLRANRLTGQLPADFSNLKFLRSLYLQNNQLSGEFPPSLLELIRLTRLDISTNNFTGKIPFSVNNLTRLTRLFMENNNFSGPLPSINPPGLVDFNVSNNHLNGSIPTSLTKFPSSAFAGNINLCGGPLQQCPFLPSPGPSPFPPPKQNPSHKKSKKLSKAAIIAIAVGGTVILLLLLLCLIICLMKRQENQPPRQPKPAVGTRSAAVAAEAGTSSSKDDIAGVSGEGGGGRGGRRNNLVFVNGGVYNFDLEDLLRASAEVLGKGSVGTSYKAVLEEGTAVVVKRLKEVGLTEKEFEMQMQALGKINHDNVVPLRAFYFSKDEKLLVSDYMAAGSLSALLHGSRGSGRPPLDWDSRMRIATSAARGLAHLHVSGRVVHGNIKSSNILLRHQDNYAAAVSDFGLNSLFDESGSPSHRVAGYRAPEVVGIRKVTFKSDVYSFGVLLLELLTGKAPNQASLGDEGIDLPRWVQSVVSEEWTAEVFDSELMRYDNIEEEMVQLLQIAMACVAIVPDQRPAMQEVVTMIEDMNMNRTETDDRLRQSSDDPSRGWEDPTPTGFRTAPRSVTLTP